MNEHRAIARRISIDGSPWYLAPLVTLVTLVTMPLGCDKPPPPPNVDAAPFTAKVASDAQPTTASSTILCFGAICAKNELCFDASHAHDAGPPYECYAVPPACAAKPTCDCIRENHEFACPAPNRLLCSEDAAGLPQVVCVMMFE